MTRYDTGKVYKVWSPLTDQIYIGSTCSSLSKRFSNHKTFYKRYCLNPSIQRYSVFNLFDLFPDSWEVSLIKEYQVVDRSHLRAYETLWVNKLKSICVNKSSPLRIHGRQLTSMLSKKKYEANREHYINASKKYYTENKERIKVYRKDYYKTNKEAFRDHGRLYYEKNRELILEKGREPYECECGTTVQKSSKSAHLKSKKHTAYLNGDVLREDKKKARYECECGATILFGSRHYHMISDRHATRIRNQRIKESSKDHN